jgi:hypothetical protein
MRRFLMEMDSLEEHGEPLFGVIESASHNTAALKARAMWGELIDDAIFIRELPDNLELPDKFIDMMVSTGIASAIIEEAGIERNGGWFDLTPEDPEFEEAYTALLKETEDQPPVPLH